MEMRRRGHVSKEEDSIIEDSNSTHEEIIEEVSAPPTQNLSTQAFDYYAFLYDFLYQSFQYVYNTFSAYLPYYEPQIDENTRSKIEQFKKLVAIPYNPQNPEDEKKLMELWTLSFPNERLHDRKTDQWHKLGFQGKDPATDFRSGGIFSLENMIYLAKQYPESFKKFVDGSHHAEKYPFSIASINLTMVLFELMGWGMRANVPTTNEAKRCKSNLISTIFASDSQRDHSITFQEFHCVIFDIFDQEWKRMNANTLDFQNVKNSTISKFQQKVSTMNYNTTLTDLTMNLN
eukprot:TRINITY_DN1859_c0_g1_i1.p1 TRINITY_DN1859_c0_g1~~TRINITY_DN1859_c0_g1_i1.p1  ORF type:complete len:289 (+),score=71.22 TRINITY_DN1859_c0_g1_i1:75-941(+)